MKTGSPQSILNMSLASQLKRKAVGYKFLPDPFSFAGLYKERETSWMFPVQDEASCSTYPKEREESLEYDPHQPNTPHLISFAAVPWLDSPLSGAVCEEGEASGWLFAKSFGQTHTWWSGGQSTLPPFFSFYLSLPS